MKTDDNPKGTAEVNLRTVDDAGNYNRSCVLFTNLRTRMQMTGVTPKVETGQKNPQTRVIQAVHGADDKPTVKTCNSKISKLSILQVNGIFPSNCASVSAEDLYQGCHCQCDQAQNSISPPQTKIR